MIITCEECSTRFTLDDSLIKPTGSKVRCSHCKHIFTAFPVAPDTLELDTMESESLEPDTSESDTMQPDLDSPGDIEFEEPDFSIPDAIPDDSFETPDIDKEPELDFSKPDSPDFDDQEIDFEGVEFEDVEFEGVEFDEIEFDEEPDFSGPDFPDSNFTDSEPHLPGTELTMDSEFEMLPSDHDEDVPAPSIDDQETALEFETSELEFEDNDLELESQDIEFEDLQLIDDDDHDDDGDDEPGLLAQKNDGESTDIESPFDQKDDPLELAGISLALDDANEGEIELEEIGLEEIEFETEEDVDLELVFDDDPDADLVFEEATEDIGDLPPSLEINDEFDTPAQLTETDEFEPDFEPELELEIEPELDFLIEDELPETQEDNNRQKFTDYDAVLDQDPEPAKISPELDDDFEPEPDLEIPDPPTPERSQMITDQAESMLIDPPSAADTRKKRAKRTKSNVGAPVKIFFLLFVLVIVAYIASLKLGADIPYLSKINIPYITDALKPAPQPQPHLKPVPNEASINGRFLSNTTAGELFIVTGRIENPSTIAYSHIKVKGTLLTKDKAKADTQLAYCGNIISEETLKTGNISDITKQLTVKQGLQNTNVNIKPSGSVLFMLVFSSLPENLTNFTVEVVDFQSPAEKK